MGIKIKDYDLDVSLTGGEKMISSDIDGETVNISVDQVKDYVVSNIGLTGETIEEFTTTGSGPATFSGGTLNIPQYVKWDTVVNTPIIPDSDITRNLGSPSVRFNTGYFRNIDLVDVGTEKLNYLGLTSDPPALSQGANYYNSNTKKLRFYDGVSWESLATEDYADSVGGIQTLSEVLVEGNSAGSTNINMADNDITNVTSIYVDNIFTNDQPDLVIAIAGVLSLSNSRISSVGAPTQPNDAVTKGYMENLQYISSDETVVTNGVRFTNIVGAPKSDIEAIGSPDANTLYIPIDAVSYEYIQIACSDLVTPITTGNTKAFTVSPVTGVVTDVYVDLLTPGTGTGITVDINKNGTTILSTDLTTDATEQSSRTATTPAVISVSSITEGDRLTIDFDAVPTAAAGIVVTIKVQKT